MKEREVWVTYLLWFLLGFVGVHKFYLGKMGWGILYIFTGGLFVIGWLVDIFTIPSQVRRYNEQLRAFAAPPVGAAAATVPPKVDASGR
jgi:TM2 domain-containing membrane protein YozV